MCCCYEMRKFKIIFSNDVATPTSLQITKHIVLSSLINNNQVQIRIGKGPVLYMYMIAKYVLRRNC